MTVASVALLLTACNPSGPAPGGPASVTGPGTAADVDRTALPIAEPTRPAITEIDARKSKAPPIFEVMAPAGAPNVLVIMLDNFGYAGSTTFGGVMNLPTIERLAKNGLTYTNFHTAPICSASRVALLTGRNPHSANMGTVSEMSTGFPGQTSILPNSVAPLAKILRFNGYSTAMFGKSHEYVAWESGLMGPFDQWPTGLGFEKFYGNVIGEFDQYSPVAHDNTTLAPPSKDPNYYYQTDLADRAIQWIKAQKSLNPDKPFFIYYPAQGMHDPVQLPKSWQDKYKGKFDMGWDKYRDEILARQKKLGIVPENTRLTAKADIAPAWDTLTADEKKVATRYQEIFAAFAELTDYEIGRVVQAIEDVGVLDNTLIVYVTGDNGATPNGGRLGVFNTLSTHPQKADVVRLANGDHITGEVKTLSRGQLELSTDDVGTLYFEWDKIVSLSAVGQFEVTTTDGRRFLGSLAAGDPKTLAIVEVANRVSLSMIDVATIAPIGASFWKRLDGSVDIGYSYTRSSQVSQLNVNTNSVFRRPAFEARTVASATLTANGDDGERDDRGTIQTSYVRYRGPHLFIASGLGFESNESLGLLVRSQLAVAAGRRLINNNRAQLAIGGGIAANDERSVDIDPTQNLEALLTFRQSYYRYDRPKTNIDIGFQYYASQNNWGRRRLQRDASAKRELLKDFYLAINIFDTFDSRPPSPDAARNDVGVSFSIGWSY